MTLKITDDGCISVGQLIEHLKQFPEEMAVVPDGTIANTVVSVGDPGGNFCKIEFEQVVIERSLKTLSKRELSDVEWVLLQTHYMCMPHMRTEVMADKAVEISKLLNIKLEHVLMHYFHKGHMKDSELDKLARKFYKKSWKEMKQEMYPENEDDREEGEHTSLTMMPGTEAKAA